MEGRCLGNQCRETGESVLRLSLDVCLSPSDVLRGEAVLPLSFQSFLCHHSLFRIKRPWIAIYAQVGIWNFLALILTNNVLPGFAFITVYGTAIIECVRANTFDGVIFIVLLLHYCVEK